MLEWIVTSQQSGDKLLVFLTQQLGGKHSARHLKRLIEHNCCQINGRVERFASTLLGHGDHVRLDLQEEVSASPLQLELQRILYEDEALLVYNKPAGLNSDEKGIVALLRSYSSSLQLVHRLDRDTTGVLLFAKRTSVLEKLIKQFKQFQIDKRYCAIVDGVVDKSQGFIENYLGKKQEYAGQAIWGAVASKGLYARTDWQCLKKGKKASLLACIPRTGRTHQIRVHLAESGHPILGDFQYSQHFCCSYRPPRYLLHAEEMRLHHPLTKDLLILQAPLPGDFKTAQQKLFEG